MQITLPTLPSEPSRRTDLEMLVLENFGACNMKCKYCFPEAMWQRDGYSSRMPLDRVAQSVSASLKVPASDVIHIRFAGGEPLLAGLEWLSEAVDICRELVSLSGRRVTFSVQTNATVVTREIAQFLKTNQFEVGVSIDGPMELNELTRGHTTSTLEGFKIIAEALGRPPGVIVTVTKCNAERMGDVIEFLASLR